jgi:hypothetical protein
MRSTKEGPEAEGRHLLAEMPMRDLFHRKGFIVPVQREGEAQRAGVDERVMAPSLSRVFGKVISLAAWGRGARRLAHRAGPQARQHADRQASTTHQRNPCSTCGRRGGDRVRWRTLISRGCEQNEPQKGHRHANTSRYQYLAIHR